MNRKLGGTFAQLHSAGCHHAGASIPDEIQAINTFGDRLLKRMIKNAGDPCRGCTYIDKGNCRAHRLFHVSPLPVAPRAQKPAETVKELSQRLGVTKSEVRRMKQRGEI